MKLFFSFLFSISFLVGKSQFGTFFINFEDTSNLKFIQIDSITNKNNSWQIGKPSKSLFDSAYSAPNAIVTDRINNYKTNDSSRFTIFHLASAGFSLPHTATISFDYKFDSDSLKDFGLIEFSPNNGKSWIDLTSDSLSGIYFERYPKKPIFTGTSKEWKSFYVRINNWDNFLNINYGDTVLYRFSFFSDSIETGQNGWMIDNIVLEDWADSVDELNSNQISTTVSPNPCKSDLKIILNSKPSSNLEIYIFDLKGNTIKRLDLHPNLELLIDVSNLSKGNYFYKLLFKDSGKVSVGEFIKI